MNHDERMRLADHINRHVIELYGDIVVLSGVYGSTARGEDVSNSDLEMLFVTEDLIRIRRSQSLHHGVLISLVLIRRESLERSLSEKPAAAPYWLSVLTSLQVLHGDGARVDDWVRMASSVDDARVRGSLASGLLGVHESYGRVLSCCEPDRMRDRAWAVADYLFQVHEMLCLVNRRWISRNTRSFSAIAEIAGLSILPVGYRNLAETMWASEDAGRVQDATRQLHEGVHAILSAAGVPMPVDHASAADLLATLELSRG